MFLFQLAISRPVLPFHLIEPRHLIIGHSYIIQLGFFAQGRSASAASVSSSDTGVFRRLARFCRLRRSS